MTFAITPAGIKTGKSKTKKPVNKVVTFRFTLNPSMELILSGLQKKYAMLDKTEIVKVALSKLATEEGLDLPNLNMDNSVNSDAFSTEEEFYNWWNANKANLRI